MFSKVQMWLSLGLIVVQTFQAVSFLGSSFKFLSDMDNIRFDQFIIRSLTTRSPLDCSRKCEIHGGCRDPFINGRDLDICFMFAGFNNLTEGMKECAAIQSNVISITSTEENDFLTRLTGTLSNVSPLNVSYKRPFIQGFWNGTAWILENRTPLVYTNWAKGHPQIDDEKRYIRSIKGKWQSTKSSAIRSIFCSYKP
uniref:C-type lectin domain-containing protein n=1 Tax=Magallana gigas TaxID=29159 RepID=A0A8W8IXQ8_MAGGI